MSPRGPAFELKLHTVRRNSLRLYRELMRNQRLPRHQLQELENRRAQEIATFAAAQSPFYRRIYAERGVALAEVGRPEVWASLPVVERAAVKEHAAGIATPEAAGRNSRDVLTGGSTGEPLRLQHDARVPTLALSWRMYSWWGVAPHDNIARVARWGFGRRETLKNDITWWPTRQVYLDATLISTDTMAVFHDQVMATRPALLEGYVGAMLELADFVEKRHLPVPPLTAIATTAAPMTEAVRTRLQSVFGAPAHDEYRGSELGWMAGECARQQGLHLFSDMRRFEVVSPQGQPLPPGEVGDLVVTDLTNRVFPLIRYKLGDRGTLLDEPCACGVTLPLMAKPDGRTTDMIRLPSGAVLAQRLMAIFSDEPEAVRLFQIHQQADHSIVVRVVLGDGRDGRAQVERTAQLLRDRINNEVPVTVEYLESLPYTGGKTKYIISDVVAP